MSMTVSATANERVFRSSIEPTSSSAPPVMPEPQPFDASGDPMAALYALLSKQRDNDTNAGKANVDHNRQLEKAQQLKEEADFKKQEDAKASAEAWGIFGKIASAIAIAVSAVASVCSCGAASGLCAAACVLSTLAFAEGETHVLTKLTNNPDVEKAFQFGCGIGAALCSGGAGIASLGANAFAGAMQIASSACKVTQESVSTFATGRDAVWVAMAFGIGSAASSLTGGIAGATGLGTSAKSAAETAKQAASTSSFVKGVVRSTSEFVAGSGEVVGGVGAVGVGMYEADAVDRGADAKEAAMQIAHLQQLTEFVIDGMKDTDKSHERALRTLSGAIQTKAQTLVIASAKV
jgi:hypothetical protein